MYLALVNEKFLKLILFQIEDSFYNRKANVYASGSLQKKALNRLLSGPVDRLSFNSLG